MKFSPSVRLALSALVIAIMVYGCSKTSSSSTSSATTTSTDLGTQADDQTMVTQEDENNTADVNGAISLSSNMTGTNSKGSSFNSGATELGGLGITPPCNATVSYDTANAVRTLTITYNGMNCDGTRSRTGTVTVSIGSGVHWADKGAVVTVKLNNLVVTRTRDGKSITINGTKTITNVTGGRLILLPTLSNIVNIVSDTFSITFPNNKVATWNVAKQHVFTYNNGLVVTTTGVHSDGTNSNIAVWGTNRFGVSFVAQITSPMIIEQSCNMSTVSGAIAMNNSNNVSTTLTFGLDSTGAVSTTCPATGSYWYAKLIWVGPAGKTYTIIYPY